MAWTLAQRTAGMNPSVIREILKLTERPGVISFAGGLPSPATFPVEALREACERVLRDAAGARAALQYAASEGFGPLREWVAHDLRRQGMAVAPAQVLITTGSQQGLDLVAKVLIDAGSKVLVESPTYLGALQAFAPMQPRFASVAGDDAGPLVEALDAEAVRDARCFYLLPNFQNPTGRTIGEARRAALVERAASLGLPLVEDNPYGDLWFDAPPPPSLAGRASDNAIYLGSFSKVLAPGLRLGYLLAPAALIPKLLQAKQAADLHTPSFNQRLVHEVIADGFLERHVPAIRALYRAQRDAMLAALERHMPQGVRWNRPAGGMFLWLQLPAPLDASELLPDALARGVAYVPGAPFHAAGGAAGTLRLSFVTASAAQIEAGIAALGALLAEQLEPVR
jgi:2-aminoadipate transaminase